MRRELRQRVDPVGEAGDALGGGQGQLRRPAGQWVGHLRAQPAVQLVAILSPADPGDRRQRPLADGDGLLIRPDQRRGQADQRLSVRRVGGQRRRGLAGARRHLGPDRAVVGHRASQRAERADLVQAVLAVGLDRGRSLRRLARIPGRGQGPGHGLQRGCPAPLVRQRQRGAVGQVGGSVVGEPAGERPGGPAPPDLGHDRRDGGDLVPQQGHGLRIGQLPGQPGQRLDPALGGLQGQRRLERLGGQLRPEVRGGAGQYGAALGLIRQRGQCRQDGLPEFAPCLVVEAALPGHQQQRLRAITRIG